MLDQAREAPLSQPDYDKLKQALHALAGMDGPEATHHRKDQECRYVLDTLGDVYRYDAEARAGKLAPAERLEFQ